jgi:hypothetical protein
MNVSSQNQLINKIGKYLLTSINQSVNDITNVLYLMYGDIYRCTDLKKDKWYELRKDKWCKIECGINLRKRLSNELVLEYARFRRFCIQMATSAMDDELPDDLEYDVDGFDLKDNISDEEWLSMAAICDEVIIKLKSYQYKDSIMKEAKEIFYYEQFEKQIHNELYDQIEILKRDNKELIEELKNYSFDNKNIYIKNISKYSIMFRDNSLILEMKDNEYVSEKELLSQDLKYSSLQNCYINNKICKSSKYASFLIELYKSISDKDFVSNSTMNIERGNRYDSGYTYCQSLGISIQGKDTLGTLKEIFHISNKYNINIELEILLRNKKVIGYRS